MSNGARRAMGAILRAAIWLPFFFGAAVAFFGVAGRRAWAQTVGLPPALSGDCSVSAAGVITCTKTSGTAFAASATTDVTNAANIISGNLAVTRIATALASPAAIGFTAPNLARIAADNNSTPDFTQAFTVPATPGAGTGTQPGTTGMTAGFTCQGLWVFLTGTTFRPVATCGDNNGSLYTYSSNGAASFGSETWTRTMTVNGAGATLSQSMTANKLSASSGAGGFQGVLYTPATSSATCTLGMFWDDASYHYVCTATNTIRRVALAAF
jgi:hypothetical protein